MAHSRKLCTRTRTRSVRAPGSASQPVRSLRAPDLFPVRLRSKTSACAGRRRTTFAASSRCATWCGVDQVRPPIGVMTVVGAGGLEGEAAWDDVMVTDMTFHPGHDGRTGRTDPRQALAQLSN